MIPKLIHQIWLNDKIDSNIQKNIDFIKEQNPTYIYKLWNNENFIEFLKKEYSNDVLETYLLINPIYKSIQSDYIRWLVLYKLGGIYLDIKSRPLKSLDLIIERDDELVFYTWAKGWKKKLKNDFGEIVNWAVVISKNSIISKKIIDKIYHRINGYIALFDKGKGNNIGILEMCGPHLVTVVIESLKEKVKYREYKLSEKRDFKYCAVKNYRKLCVGHWSKCNENYVK